MASLATSGLSLPDHLASGIWSKVQTGSTVAALSGATPMLFGETQLMTFTGKPKAQFVAEGAQKSATDPTFATKTVTPKKAQVTMRFNEEVQWADEDYQLGVLTALSEAASEALARALDLGVYHGINPLSGTAFAAAAENIVGDSTNQVEDAGDADEAIEAAAGLVIADGFVPDGIALDSSYAWTLATTRYSDGRKVYPELGLGSNITGFLGLNAAVSTTVSAPETSGGATAVKAIVGDFSALRWGVQRRIGIERIETGDPDGQGDLKRNNQIALRAEVVYGWAIMDLDAFAVISDATS